MKIKIKKLDKIFSTYIRTRDKWRCQYCMKEYPPPTNALHCAHIFTRGAQSTRFDPENAVALCYGHHSWLDANPLTKYEFYIKKFGQKQFDVLRLRSNTPTKIDRDAIEKDLKEKIAKLQPFVFGKRS